MINSTLRTQVANLMSRASDDFIKELSAKQNDDLDWPVWYANYLREPLNQLFQRTLSLSELIYCLMTVAFERKIMQPDADQASFFAEHFVEHFAPSKVVLTDELALYYSPFCPFCTYVNNAIERLNITVELLDVYNEPKYYQELVSARKRGTVPVLKITSASDDIRLIPESQDIVDYLDKEYGE